MENLNGFIKIHRKLLKWEWYSDLNVRVLFFHCLLKANHKSEKWQGIEIKAGQFVTSYGHLAKECGLTVHQTRTALDKLKMTGEIANKTTSRYSIITIKNWNLYQANGKQDGKQMANRWQTNGNKQEIKEDKEVKNLNLSLINSERLGKREREFLKSFCERKGIRNVNAYIRTVIDNGDWVELVEEEKQYQCKAKEQELQAEENRKKIKLLKAEQRGLVPAADYNPKKAQAIFDYVRKNLKGSK